MKKTGLLPLVSLFAAYACPVPGYAQDTAPGSENAENAADQCFRETLQDIWGVEQSDITPDFGKQVLIVRGETLNNIKEECEDRTDARLSGIYQETNIWNKHAYYPTWTDQAPEPTAADGCLRDALRERTASDAYSRGIGINLGKNDLDPMIEACEAETETELGQESQLTRYEVHN